MLYFTLGFWTGYTKFICDRAQVIESRGKVGPTTLLLLNIESGQEVWVPTSKPHPWLQVLSGTVICVASQAYGKWIRERGYICRRYRGWRITNRDKKKVGHTTCFSLFLFFSPTPKSSHQVLHNVDRKMFSCWGPPLDNVRKIASIPSPPTHTQYHIVCVWITGPDKRRTNTRFGDFFVPFAAPKDAEKRRPPLQVVLLSQELGWDRVKNLFSPCDRQSLKLLSAQLSPLKNERRFYYRDRLPCSVSAQGLWNAGCAWLLYAQQPREMLTRLDLIGSWEPPSYLPLAHFLFIKKKSRLGSVTKPALTFSFPTRGWMCPQPSLLAFCKYCFQLHEKVFVYCCLVEFPSCLQRGKFLIIGEWNIQQGKPVVV